MDVHPPNNGAIDHAPWLLAAWLLHPFLGSRKKDSSGLGVSCKLIGLQARSILSMDPRCPLLENRWVSLVDD